MDPKNIQVMLDLETMGVESNSVICSIGAVKFDVRRGPDDPFIDEFYTTIDAEDCANNGLVFSQTTIDWWKKQPKEVLAQLRKDTVPLRTALEKFTSWFGPRSLPVWGCGAGFDNVLLENAYKAIGEVRPWVPWDDRCYRTVKNLIMITPPKREGTYHNALDDARYQTKHLLMMLHS